MRGAALRALGHDPPAYGCSRPPGHAGVWQDRTGPGAGGAGPDGSVRVFVGLVERLRASPTAAATQRPEGGQGPGGEGGGRGRAGRDNARELFRRRTPPRTAAREAKRAANRMRRSATCHHMATAAQDRALRTERSFIWRAHEHSRAPQPAGQTRTAAGRCHGTAAGVVATVLEATAAHADTAAHSGGRSYFDTEGPRFALAVLPEADLYLFDADSCPTRHPCAPRSATSLPSGWRRTSPS